MVQAQEGAKDELEDIDITGISDVKEEKLSPEEEDPAAVNALGPVFATEMRGER